MASVYVRQLKSGKMWFASVRRSDGRWKAYNTHLAAGKYKKRDALDHAKKMQVEIEAGRDPFRKKSGDPNKPARLPRSTLPSVVRIGERARRRCTATRSSY